MGSKPCCCKKNLLPGTEMSMIKEEMSPNFKRVIIEPIKPIPLEKPKPLQEEDDFGLFLVMEQYERLINKYRRKSRSFSPAGDLLTFSKENMTSLGIKKHLRIKSQKKTRSLTTKISTSLQSTYAVKSILKNKEIPYNHQQSDQQKSVRSVHFNVVVSPRNSINRKTEFPSLKKKKLLCKAYF